MFIGEAFVGEGQNAAHVSTLFGPRDGPVGTAWALAMATPNPGHAPFMVFLQPGLTVKPPTLFVNRATLGGQIHREMTLGAAHAGVAAGVLKMVQKVGDEIDVETSAIIASVWVDPDAYEGDVVFMNNKAATSAALLNGLKDLPAVDEVLEQVDSPWNESYTRYKPYF